MHRGVLMRVVLAYGLALGCAGQPVPGAEPEPAVEPEPEPGPEIDLTRNSGEALIALADRITHLELSDGEQVIMRFDDVVRAELVESLREAELDGGLSATSPPWPGHWVLVHVEGRAEPFVASIVSFGSLRVNARDPLSDAVANEQGELDLENIADVGYSELLFDAVSERLGGPRSKEYGPAPALGPPPGGDKKHARPGGL